MISSNPSLILRKPSPFFNIYALPHNDVESLAENLRSTDFLDSLPKLFNDPASFIVSLRRYPTDITMGHADVHFQKLLIGGKPVKQPNSDGDVYINAYKITDKAVTEATCSVEIPTHFNDFRDFSPYTTISLYIPYIGIRELDPARVIGKTVYIEYCICLYTGDMTVAISTYEGVLDIVESTLGANVGFNAFNGAQIAGATLSLVTSLATSKSSTDALTRGLNSVAGGAFKVAPTVSSTSESTNSMYFEQTPCAYITRSVFDDSNSTERATIVGQPSYVVRNLNDLGGYSEISSFNITCAETTDINSAATPTDDEIGMISTLLREGAIF